METLQQQISETAVNLLAPGSRIEGKVTFDRVTRVHGVIHGEVRATDGSVLILAETSAIEGNIQADTLIVDGFVQGNIQARTKVLVSRTGRVIGDIEARSLQLEPGAFFEGRCKMASTTSATPSTQAFAPAQA
jgi:cytoskeletal protein CcmA (bactofilin family)